MFRSVIEAVVDRHDNDSIPQHRDPRRGYETTSVTMSSPTDVMWLEKIGKWLPGSWADISDRAVKSDNVPIDYRPWHRRIQLVLPCDLAIIEIFERLSTRRWEPTCVGPCFCMLSQFMGKTGDTHCFFRSKRGIGIGAKSQNKRICMSEPNTSRRKGGGW